MTSLIYVRTKNNQSSGATQKTSDNLYLFDFYITVLFCKLQPTQSWDTTLYFIMYDQNKTYIETGLMTFDPNFISTSMTS